MSKPGRRAETIAIPDVLRVALADALLLSGTNIHVVDDNDDYYLDITRQRYVLTRERISADVFKAIEDLVGNSLKFQVAVGHGSGAAEFAIRRVKQGKMCNVYQPGKRRLCLVIYPLQQASAAPAGTQACTSREIPGEARTKSISATQESHTPSRTPDEAR